MALVSTSSFTAVLLRPSVEVVIVVHGFVARGARQATDDRVRRIVAERQRRACCIRSPEVLVDGLPDETGQGGAASPRLMAELAVHLLRKPEDGRLQACHSG
jgi:hypothetical protein